MAAARSQCSRCDAQDAMRIAAIFFVSKLYEFRVKILLSAMRSQLAIPAMPLLKRFRHGRPDRGRFLSR
jgi:hypothetical protein